MVDRVIIGEKTTGNPGLWVSKPGEDVFSTDLSKFLFAMESILPLHTKGSVTLSATTSPYNASVTVNHNLGYKPVMFVQGIAPAVPVNFSNPSEVDVRTTNTTAEFRILNSNNSSGLYPTILYYAIFRAWVP